MKKSKLIEYQRKISEVLGYERLHNLHKIQKQSLNNQLNDLIEEHNYVVESITAVSCARNAPPVGYIIDNL